MTSLGGLGSSDSVWLKLSWVSSLKPASFSVTESVNGVTINLARVQAGHLRLHLDHSLSSITSHIQFRTKSCGSWLQTHLRVVYCSSSPLSPSQSTSIIRAFLLVWFALLHWVSTRRQSDFINIIWSSYSLDYTIQWVLTVLAGHWELLSWNRCFLFNLYHSPSCSLCPVCHTDLIPASQMHQAVAPLRGLCTQDHHWLEDSSKCLTASQIPFTI